MPDQFHHERARHPDTLATEVIKLRREVAQLRRELEAIHISRILLPVEYALALHHAHFIAHGAPVTSQETPGRPHQESTAPGYNPAAYGVLDREQRELRVRATHLTNAADWAAEHPESHGRPRQHRRAG